MSMKQYEFWFVVGSQFLYGPEVLETVARRAAEMADWMNASGKLPCKVVYKVTAKTQKEIADVVREANYQHAPGDDKSQEYDILEAVLLRRRNWSGENLYR